MRRSGAVLLEAIVALAILSIAGTWAVAMANQASIALHQAIDADRDIERASAFVDAVSLWPREDLDRHLGDRAEGPWTLMIQRETLVLYDVTLTDGPPPGRVLLHTTLYRPLATR